MRSKPTRRPARPAVVSRPALSAARPPRGSAGAAGSLLARLGPDAFERLEGRVHLSVSRDVNGYTVVNPGAADQIYYVSAAGSDTNNGLSASAPLKTVAAAAAKTDNGSGDQILLRRGDTFTAAISGWTLSGRSASEPFVIGAYTDPAQPSAGRPKVASGISSGFANSTKAPVNNLYILGVSFEAQNRNYRNPTSGFTVGYKDDAQGGTYGMNILGSVSNLLVEDCSFQYYRTGLAIQETSDTARPTAVKLRRNVVTDNYAPSFNSLGQFITSEGMYAQGVNGLAIEENVFDHNGWMDPAFGNYGAIPTIYNHNAYLNTLNDGIVITGNTFANGSSHGVQVRAGGVVTNNLFIDNPIAMSYGYVNGSEKAGGVSGEISGNVVYGSNDISGSARGWGLEIANTKAKANGGGTVVKNNVYIGSDYAAQGREAIQLSFGTNTNNPTEAVGINDLTFQSNIVYNWNKAVYINPGFVNGGTTRLGYKGVSFLNNEFQQTAAAPIVYHGTAYSAAVETWSGNRYNTKATGSPFQLKVGGVVQNQSFAQWQAAVEPTALSQKIAYPDPTRSPATYNAALGGTATLDGYLADARTLSSRAYRPALLGSATAAYIKEGFSGPRTDGVPPAGLLAAEDITAGGATSQTFTVTWTDDTQVDVATLGAGDVVVTGPGGYSQAAALVSTTVSADRTTVAAVYTVPAPAGAWSAAANGAYTVAVAAGQVKDAAGNAAAAAPIGGFAVNIAAGAPTATLAAVAAITSPLVPATLTVTYAVPGGGSIDVATLGDGDLLVAGPGGAEMPVTLVSVSPAGNGSPRTAVYRLAPPAGGWTFDSNGTYSVAVQDNEVASVAGGLIGHAVLGTFAVNVTVPKAVATAPEINGPTTAGELITVRYTAVGGVSAASIDANDIKVQGPGYTASAATGLSVVSVAGQGTAASPLVAVYRAPAPAGGFTSAQNAAYDIVLNANQVKATDGTAANAGIIGSFNVAFDVEGPVGALITSNIYRPNANAKQAVTVIYSDPSGINAATLTASDILVTLPNGQNATTTLKSVTTTATTATVVYEIGTPGGLTTGQNGSYTVNLVSGNIADTKGNKASPNFLGVFEVNIDTVAPVVFASPTGIGDALQDLVFNVGFTDQPGIDLTTLDDNDILITGPNGFSAPAVLDSVEAFGGSNPIVTYRLAAPANGWQQSQNGTYNIVVRANQLADLSGNFAAAGLIGTFTVNVLNSVSVAVDPVTPNPAAPGVNVLTLRFNQHVDFLDLGDLTLTKDGGPNLLKGTESLTTSDDNVTWTLSGLSPLTQATGTYTLTVLSGTDLRGEFGGRLLRDVTSSFAVDSGMPSAVGQAPNITAAATTAEFFTVTYTDRTGIDVGTLSDGDLIVTGPNGYSQLAHFVSVDVPSNGPVRIATYSVPAPAGGWTAASNGSYAIRVRADQVADVDGNFVAAGFAASFDVAIPTTTVDTTPPTFAFQAPAVTSASAAAVFTITWSDPSGVDAATIGAGDVIVTGPANNSAYRPIASLVSVVGSGTSIVATYSVPAPAGGWTAALNGSYAVNVRANQVADVLGNVVPVGFVGAVTVSIGAATDTMPPTATVSAVASPRSTPVDSLTITFSEPVAGFDLSDLTLTRSGGGNLLGTSATLSTTDNKTFTLTGLTSLTGVAGDYVLTLKGSGTGIADLAGNLLAGGATSAWTTVAAPAGTPVLTSVSPNPVTASATAQTFTLTGSSFASNALVGLTNLTTGVVTTPTVVSRTATQIVVSMTFGTTTGAWNAAVYNGTAGSNFVNFQVVAPATLAISPSANPVTGKTVVLTAANPGTNAATTFTWSTTSVPSGAAAPTYSANGTNAAKVTTATFTKAGTYAFKLTSTTGSTVKTATLTVVVNQTITSVTVTPATVTLAAGQAQQFTAVAKDQFGAAFATPPAFTWALASGVGTVSAAGLYAAPATAGSAVVRATAGSVSATAAVTVNGPVAPLGISASANPVTGKTVVLTAVNPGTNTATKFLWSTTSVPSGATAPTYSANNTNAAKTTTATFSKAGTYVFKLTSTTGTTVTTATLTVVVNQALTSLTVTPTTATVTQGKTQQFAVSAKDQFGAVLATQPAATWALASGIGSVSAAGLYTAPATATGSATVRASVGTLSGTATVTVAPVKINFQPAAAATVSGYLIDSGLTYASRNSLTYGWSVSHADAAVDRAKNSNQLLDTNIGIKSGGKWELAVANGQYTVLLSVGDGTAATTNTVRLEGTTVVSGVKLAANVYSSKTATVTVTDGKLTLDAGSAASLATRLDYIQITRIS
jgi:hypothetical protein